MRRHRTFAVPGRPGIGTFGAAVTLALVLAACASNGPLEPDESHRLGLLTATPGAGGLCFEAGRHVLDLGLARDPVLYFPPGYDRRRAWPLVVLFHGAGGSAESWQSPYRHADRLGLALLLMQSRGATWDLVRGGWGDDIAATDRALDTIFRRCSIDADRITLAGFSDGASYALSLGLSNGRLVRHVIAFSPGFETARLDDPKPRVFISHGTGDPVLPISLTSRRMVATLRAAGYDVTYLEFDGGHEVPADVSAAAFDWLP